MKDIKLDKDYNFIEEKNVYDDNFIESIDLIARAQSDNVITDTEASFLYKVALKKEIKKEAKAVVPFANNTPEITSFFMNMKSKQIKHV